MPFGLIQLVCVRMWVKSLLTDRLCAFSWHRHRFTHKKTKTKKEHATHKNTSQTTTNNHISVQLCPSSCWVSGWIKNAALRLVGPKESLGPAGEGMLRGRKTKSNTWVQITLNHSELWEITPGQRGSIPTGPIVYRRKWHVEEGAWGGKREETWSSIKIKENDRAVTSGHSTARQLNGPFCFFLNFRRGVFLKSVLHLFVVIESYNDDTMLWPTEPESYRWLTSEVYEPGRADWSTRPRHRVAAVQQQWPIASLSTCIHIMQINGGIMPYKKVPLWVEARTTKGRMEADILWGGTRDLSVQVRWSSERAVTDSGHKTGLRCIRKPTVSDSTKQ